LNRFFQPGLTLVLFAACLAVAGQCEPDSAARSSPRQDRLELIFRAADVRVESPTAQLHVWVAEPTDGPGQDGIQRLSCQPAPTEVFDDPEFGNRILYFDLSPALLDGATIEIRRTYLRTGWRLDFDPASVEAFGPLDPGDPRVIQYTRPERWLERPEEIYRLAHELTSNATSEWEKVRSLTRWTGENCGYVYPPPTGRGALEMLSQRKGDCGQYACLFIALARAAGIPSRFIAGLPIDPETGGMGAHAWAEVWFPRTGWLVVDPTRPLEELGTLSPESVVMTRGLNIPIPRVPAWASYDNSEVTAGEKGDWGRTEFIQNACVAARGFQARYSTGRHAELISERGK
jgi:transglutaminase-like putative cysteine protease